MPIDAKKFTKSLYAAADKVGYGKRRCGEFVRKALQAGGAKGHFPATGGQFGSTLLRLGFHEVPVDDPDKFNFVSGDVMVMQPRKGTTEGHVAGFDGKRWVSDFVQRDFWAGPECRKERPSYAVYRY